MCVCVMCERQTVSVCPNPVSASPMEPPRDVAECCQVGRGTRLKAALIKAWLGDESPTQYATSKTYLFRYKVHPRPHK